MTVTMYDSTTPSSIPKDAIAIAAYDDGVYGLLTAKLRSEFPAAAWVTIDVTGIEISARVIDVEHGDVSPTFAALWCARKIDTLGQRPTIYCDDALWAACSAALQARGLAFGTDVDWWEAHYDGVARISAVPGAVAKQYLSDAAANLDTSVALATWVAGVVASPIPDPNRKQAYTMISTGCTDDGAVRAQIRQWWTTYRSDPMTVNDQDFILFFFHQPVGFSAYGAHGLGGSPDLLLASIIDGAGQHLRPQLAGSV